MWKKNPCYCHEQCQHPIMSHSVLIFLSQLFYFLKSAQPSSREAHAESRRGRLCSDSARFTANLTSAGSPSLLLPLSSSSSSLTMCKKKKKKTHSSGNRPTVMSQRGQRYLPGLAATPWQTALLVLFVFSPTFSVLPGGRSQGPAAITGLKAACL